MRDFSEVSADLGRFLGRVRSRLRRAVWAGGGSLALALTAFATLVAVLVASRSAGDTSLRTFVAIIIALALVSTLVAWVFVPLRGLRTDAEIARYVGGRKPEVASDLMSAVELGAELGRGEAAEPGWSRVLATEHVGQTVARVAGVEPES